jgi:hypothetical protein
MSDPLIRPRTEELARTAVDPLIAVDRIGNELPFLQQVGV